MSYFRPERMAFAEDNPCVVEDIERDVEVAEGVVVERRSVLWMSAAAVTAMLTGAGSARGQDQKPQERAQEKAGKLSFEEFLKLLLPQARRLVDSKGEDEEAYLMTVAAAMSRLKEPNAPIREAMRKFSKDNRKEGERFPINAMAMTLKPGGGFPHHDHLNYNGIIMGLEGEVRIRNYDFQSEPPATGSTDTFEIRETRDDLILPGRFSSLGRKRENIHDVVAGKNGARVLDVFTFYERNATSRYLNVEDKPRDAEARIYEATWKQRRRRRNR